MSARQADLAVLKRRAAALARPTVAVSTWTGSREVLVTLVGKARYAVRLDALSAVVTLPRLTRLPQAPAWVAGLAPLHGRILTIVDLGTLLGETGAATPRFALVLEHNAEPFGLGVPALVGLEPDRAHPGAAVPGGVGEPARHLIEAVSPEGVCRLNLLRLVETLNSQKPQGSTAT